MEEKHIEQQKEFADQFLAELVRDLDELLAKYSSKLPFRFIQRIVSVSPLWNGMSK